MTVFAPVSHADFVVMVLAHWSALAVDYSSQTQDFADNAAAVPERIG